jgi:glycosyltransferase involved in cell wall biosynthesis
VSEPAVSVVIPAYNAQAFIAETLKTVAAQTHRDFETIVVDDGSQDETHAVSERFLRENGLRGRCIRQENKKIAGARNTGVREARSRFIAFLDHDDAWHPEKLEAVMREFALHPKADLVCHNENVTENGRLLKVKRYGPWVADMYGKLLFKGNDLSPSCVTVKREAILAVGGFRENPDFNTVEDYDLWMRLSRVCRFHFLDRVLGEYHFEERGASRRIAYHHSNLEHLLRDHFCGLYGGRPGLLDRVRMRRRLAAVQRSALGLLMSHSESPELQRQYALRMLRTFPFDPKNAAKALLWLGGRLCRR